MSDERDIPKMPDDLVGSPVRTRRSRTVSGQRGSAPRTASGWERRARSRRTKVVVAGVIALGVLAIFGGLAARAYLNARPDALVAEAVEYVARADVNIVQMDDVLNSQVTTATMSEIANVRPGVEVAIDALETAQALLVRAKDKDPSINSEVRLLEQAIDARLDMLALAPPLVNLTDGAGVSLIAALDGFRLLSQANEGAGLAKDAFDPTSAEAIGQSREMAGQAVEAYRSAEASFIRAAEALPTADYSAYADYIGLRVQMLQALQSAGDHIGRNEPALANEQIRKLNSLNDQSTTVAGSRLLPVEAIVEAGYESAAGTISADYSAARAKVLELDKLVR